MHESGENVFLSLLLTLPYPVSKRVKSGVKRILKRNQQITDLQAVVTPPRSRINLLVPPKEDEEEVLSSDAEDSLYESIDNTQMTGENHL